MAKTRRKNNRKRGGTYKTATKTDNYMFEVDEDETNILMYIWLPNNYPCIFVLINKETNEAHIDSVLSHPRCTVDTYMKKRGGSAAMINFILNKLKERDVHTVTLDDNSEFDCEGVRVKLYIHNFILYGMTWYERVFGFQIAEKNEQYENSKRLRQQNIEKINKIKEEYKEDCTKFTPEIMAKFEKELQLGFLRGTHWIKHI